MSNDGVKLDRKAATISASAWYYTRCGIRRSENENIVYVLNVNFLKSTDGGKSSATSTRRMAITTISGSTPPMATVMIADDGGAQVSRWRATTEHVYEPAYGAVLPVSTENHYPYRII